MMLSLAAITGAAYLAATLLAAAGGYAVMSLWLGIFAEIGHTWVNVLGLIVALLVILVIFQQVFGRLTGLGHGRAFWLAGSAIVALSFGGAYLLALSPFVKAEMIDPALDRGGYGQAFTDAIWQAAVLFGAWLLLAFVLGLITALLVAWRNAVRRGSL